MVVGELTEGGQRDFWTFEGQSGQQVSVAMQSAEIDSFLTLNGPDGQEVAADDDSGGNRDALIFGLTLPETGAYTIVARAFDDYQTGRYRLILMHGAATPEPSTPTPAPTSVPAGALSSGVAVEGMLPAGATEAWTFAGEAGDVVSLALATAAFDAYLSVYGPDGALLAFDDDSGPGTNALVHEVALPAGGVYSVEVRAAAGYGGGAYTLTLYDQDTAPPPASGAGVLTPGETVMGALAAGQVDMWAFTLEAGATAALVATPTGGDLYQVDIDLASPAAGEVAVGVNAVTHPLAEPGEYVVSIYAFGDQSGSYTLTLTLSDLPVVGGGAIGVGQSVEAHLEPGARDTWTLAGPHGAPVAIAMTALGATPFDTYLEIYAPDGSIVAMDDDGGAGYNAMVTALNLTAAGDYEIVARGYDATGGGMYRLEVFEMPTIALGETVTGALTDPEDSAIWAFTIAARTAVNLTVDGVGDFVPVAELYDPNGYFLVDDWETPIQNFPLNRPGTYTVVVAGYGEVGAFSLALSEGELPVDRGGPIAFGSRVAGVLVTPGQIATWTFRAEAETVITVLLESPVFDAYLEVYDADGVLIAEDDDSAGATNAQLTGFALPGAGEYRLVVRSYGFVETGAYELGLFRGTIVPKPPGVDGRVELGQTVEGAISAVGQRDTWRFTPRPTRSSASRSGAMTPSPDACTLRSTTPTAT
ncbi:MAG: PPC domain-containing protein [Anaerolineae bacterium]|nr:PPC domain-containing protein [Anaerolineae bacterium]